MTLNEYQRKVELRIRSAIDRDNVNIIIDEVDKNLINNSITKYKRNIFWEELYHQLGGELTPMFESQGSSALSSILDEAKKAIKEKANS